MAKVDVTLGIDIGGTNTVFGFVDKEGNCLIESSIPTCSNEKADKLFARLYPAVNETFAKISEKCNFIGIGIGAPNANYYKGTVEQPPNLNWGTVNVIEMVKKYYDIPSAITNDANAAAIGEMQFGAARGMKDFIVITLGTGLGSGIVVNGSLVYGHDGFAGEVGHTIYDPEGRHCGCGRQGCLETYASASGIRRTVYELICDTTIESELRGVSFNDLTAKMIYEAAAKGDKLALEAFEFTGKVLGIKLADAVAHTSPEAIILFGGLAASGDLIFEPTKRYMEKYMLNIFKNKVKLLPSALTKGNTAVLGASALIWNELEKTQKS
ncbi:MAG: ROK family protein [Bacteroidota bacterium]|jgi:glucokinase|nr:ROK family protein [Ignavibacteria bacterium]MCU7499102.1 ROK family protein [Ignavibacteria bacterium]MCU7512238.1 ROK family protein [Ignavibacteria bacterium]MCU7520996.1 ROK family protein [Ignavibacteria bacterium]MCU7524245.1 ROK family protein [Ignavibacteria bacterium]